MELFCRRIWTAGSTQQSNMYGWLPCLCSRIFLVCHKHNSLPLWPMQPSSRLTKELHGSNQAQPFYTNNYKDSSYNMLSIMASFFNYEGPSHSRGVFLAVFVAPKLLIISLNISVIFAYPFLPRLKIIFNLAILSSYLKIEFPQYWINQPHNPLVSKIKIMPS